MLALGGSGQCFEQTIYTAPLTREPSSQVTQLVLSPYCLGRSLPKVYDKTYYETFLAFCEVYQSYDYAYIKNLLVCV